MTTITFVHPVAPRSLAAAEMSDSSIGASHFVPLGKVTEGIVRRAGEKCGCGGHCAAETPPGSIRRAADLALRPEAEAGPGPV